jgi:drug/metabolite transporter (DMT)-like permease
MAWLESSCFHWGLSTAGWLVWTMAGAMASTRWAFAVLAVVGQSSGMIFAKLGVYGDFPALTGTLMRVVISSIAMWVLALFSGQVTPSIKALKNDHKALGFIALGALTGPFLGIWFSLIGLQNTDVGIASTLQSLSPVLVLPVSMFVYKEKISARALIGTVVAMVGVAFIFILA